MATPRGRTEHQFLHKKMSTYTLKEVLRYYDPARSAMASDATLEKLLEIYKLNATQIPSFEAIRLVMATKTRQDIVRELSKRGYV